MVITGSVYTDIDEKHNLLVPCLFLFSLIWKKLCATNSKTIQELFNVVEKSGATKEIEK